MDAHAYRNQLSYLLQEARKGAGLAEKDPLFDAVLDIIDGELRHPTKDSPEPSLPRPPRHVVEGAVRAAYTAGYNQGREDTADLGHERIVAYMATYIAETR